MPEVAFTLGGTLQWIAPSTGYALVTVACRNGITVTARGENMAYTLPTDQQVAVKVSYVDAKGNPAAVDGPVTWASSNEAIVTVVSQDEDEAMVTPGAQLGQAQITATADADLGQGTRSLITTMDVTIVAGEAVAGTIEPVGAPVPIPGGKKK